MGEHAAESQRGSDQAIDAALAEFAALRALMATRVQLQVALLTAALTATGVIASIALQHDGNRNLLLFIPILASVVAIIHSDQRSRIGLSGRYIRDRLWPYIQAKTDPTLPSWERYWWEHSNKAAVLIGGAQAASMLVLVGALSLISRSDAAMAGDGYTVLWWLGALLTISSVLYSFRVAFAFPLTPRQ